MFRNTGGTVIGGDQYFRDKLDSIFKGLLFKLSACAVATAMGLSHGPVSRVCVLLVCALMPFLSAESKVYVPDLQCIDATLVQTCDDILIGELIARLLCNIVC